MKRDSFERDFAHSEQRGRFVHPSLALDADLDAMLKNLPDSVRIPDQVDAILQSVSQQQPLVTGRDLRIRRWSRLVLGATAVGLSVVAVMTAAWLPEISGHADSNRPVAGVMRSSQQAASLGFGGLEALSVRLGLLAEGDGHQSEFDPQMGSATGLSQEASLSGALARSMLLPAAGLDRPLMLGHFEQQDGGALRLVIESSEVLGPQVQSQMQIVSALAESAWDRASRLTRGSLTEQVPAEPETFADLLVAAVESGGDVTSRATAIHEASHRPSSMPAVDAEGGASPAVKIFSLPPQ